MNNVVMFSFELSGEYRPLSEQPLVASVDISAPPDNTDSILFRGMDGRDVIWIRGEWHTMIRVDLSTIYVKGTLGDVVSVVGGTW